MFFKAIKKHNIDAKKSIMIGDKVSDMQAAYNANIKKRVIINNYLTEYSTHKYSSLKDLYDEKL